MDKGQDGAILDQARVISKKLSRSHRRWKMSQVTKPRSGVLATCQQHESYSQILITARAFRVALVTQKVFMRSESMPYAKSVQSDLLCCSCASRPSRFEGRLDHSEFISRL